MANCCYKGRNKDFKTPSIHKALTALQVTDFDPEDWIPDSGPSSHMSSASLFSTLTKYEGADTVMVGNGQFLRISHIVCVQLITSGGFITLNNVLHVLLLNKTYYLLAS